MPNRLSQESSPYLLQHALNPVDWFPWGEEALALARTENRPILLSIGYSACHWCHVMERESFEDPNVAGVMNELFVNIKVDREERPDLDQIYMKSVQAMTGGGGWPLTAFLTPEGVPYYGGTYFPPVPRHGMPSFTQVLQAASAAYQTRPDDVRSAGTQLLDALRRSSSGSTASAGAPSEALAQAFRALSKQYDADNGGFGSAPKFPQPVTLELLMRHHIREPDSDAAHMAIHTLRRMAAGGMRDHLGGGFHRYSVDARWLVPHFEKMLYDNALLARAFVDGYRLTGSDDLRVIAEETLDYVAGDLRSPDGGFYSARDADSEGEEGTFYVWTPAQLSEVLIQDAGAGLTEDDVELFARVYDVSEGGNFEGRNILHLPHEISAVAQSRGVTEPELRGRLAAVRALLLGAREQREPPFRDEKILVSWSAMTTRAFAESGAALGRWDYVDLATEAAEFLWTEMRPEGELQRVHKDGRSKIPGFLEDYAALANALLSLHSASLDPRWLTSVQVLCEEIIDRFWSEEEGLFFDTQEGGETLILRPRDPMDNATPSGVSMTAELLVRASRIFGSAHYEELAQTIFERESEALTRFGSAFGRMLSVLDRSLAEPVEVAIVGAPERVETRALIRAAHEDLARNLTVVGRPPDAEVHGVPLLQEREQLDGRPTAYVCRGYECRLPVHDAADVREQMKALLK